MNISAYLHDKAELRRFLRFGPDGTAEYADHKEIQCRIQPCRKAVVNQSGETKTSETLIFVSDMVHVHDLIILNGQEWPVLQSTPIKGLYGNISHYEVLI